MIFIIIGDSHFFKNFQKGIEIDINMVYNDN